MSAAAKTTEGTGTWSCKAKMTVTLEAILLLLVGCSSLTDGASKLLQKCVLTHMGHMAYYTLGD